MTDIAKQLHIAQQCYEDMTRRKKKPSGWKLSIGKKVNLFNFHKTLIELNLAGEKLEDESLKDAKNYVRTMNVILALKRKLS
ncbi:unnamed protein product [Thelazia callipaeda]|uniref:Phage protein n=1 Tax=Thelazia callipaeda TaxID=103827 RepID=A0A0N5CPZ0_THECL|nr:unnamed protein product [Thelazia callipaeda]